MKGGGECKSKFIHLHALLCLLDMYDHECKLFLCIGEIYVCADFPGTGYVEETSPISVDGADQGSIVCPCDATKSSQGRKSSDMQSATKEGLPFLGLDAISPRYPHLHKSQGTCLKPFITSQTDDSERCNQV